MGRRGLQCVTTHQFGQLAHEEVVITFWRSGIGCGCTYPISSNSVSPEKEVISIGIILTPKQAVQWLLSLSLLGRSFLGSFSPLSWLHLIQFDLTLLLCVPGFNHHQCETVSWRASVLGWFRVVIDWLEAEILSQGHLGWESFRHPGLLSFLLGMCQECLIQVHHIYWLILATPLWCTFKNFSRDKNAPISSLPSAAPAATLTSLSQDQGRW